MLWLWQFGAVLGILVVAWFVIGKPTKQYLRARWTAIPRTPSAQQLHSNAEERLRDARLNLETAHLIDESVRVEQKTNAVLDQAENKADHPNPDPGHVTDI